LTAAALLAGLPLIPSAFGAERVRVETFDQSQAAYAVETGGEFPGAAVTLAWDKAGETTPGALAIGYDFTKGGQYVGWYYSGFMPAPAGQLAFAVRSDRAVALLVRLLDATGQTHQYTPAVPANARWQVVTIPLAAASAPGRFWGGKNDGVLHFPLVKILIGVEKAGEPVQGTLLVDDMSFTTTATPAELAQQQADYYWRNATVAIQTQRPGNLFYPDEPVTGDLAMTPHPLGAEFTGTAEVFDIEGKPAATLPGLKLNRNNHYRATLNLPRTPGFYRVAVTLTGDGHTQNSESRYAVIPANRELARKDPASPFGVNTHFNQGWPADLGAIAKRAGIAWIRDGEASLEDRAVAVARANQLCYLPCFTAYTTTALNHRDAKGGWDFTAIAAWHRQYAEKYGKDIDAYDLMNEPASAWSAVLGGGWWGGPWLESFVIYGRQVTQALKQGDPGCTVLWEDVDQLLWYKRFQQLGAGDTIDAISPHPYNLHRSAPLPEDQPILRQYAEFREFTRRHQLTWPLWLGEIGFSSYDMGEPPPMFYSPSTEAEQAQFLVRMMVLHLAAGVQRIFWYDLRNDGWERHNPEHNFGLIRTDSLPKPAVVAYANLSHRLTGCRWLGSYAIGGNAQAVAAACRQGAAPTLIAWLRQGAKSEAIPVASDAQSLTVTDIYGRSRSLPVVNHLAELPLSASPIYIDGLTLDDLQPYLQTAAPTGN
jgi:hypothetical protein